MDNQNLRYMPREPMGTPTPSRSGPPKGSVSSFQFLSFMAGVVIVIYLFDLVNGDDQTPAPARGPSYVSPFMGGPVDRGRAVDESPADSGHQLAQALSGTWKGEYRCAQGLTGLTLVLDADDDGALLGTFTFYPLPSNADVPAGSYAMKGNYDISSMSLAPDRWIQQPLGYGMIGLRSRIPSEAPSHLSGEFSEDQCAGWNLNKVSTGTS